MRVLFTIELLFSKANQDWDFIFMKLSFSFNKNTDCQLLLHIVQVLQAYRFETLSSSFSKSSESDFFNRERKCQLFILFLVKASTVVKKSRVMRSYATVVLLRFWLNVVFLSDAMISSMSWRRKRRANRSMHLYSLLPCSIFLRLSCNRRVRDIFSIFDCSNMCNLINQSCSYDERETISFWTKSRAVSIKSCTRVASLILISFVK